MDEHYRRLHYEAGQPQYWTQPPHKAVALTRLKRHLPAIPKKKNKDIAKNHFDFPAKHSKDKYGSVSAHSTSAIYGALRAPHYHTIYDPSKVWYASVRSLNRGCPRDFMYSAEAFDWRDTVYEDVAKEVFPASPPIAVIPAGACVCLVRSRPPHENASHSKRPVPRCKYCANGYLTNSSTNGVQSKRLPPNTEKIKTPSISEEGLDSKPDMPSRMSGYKKCISGHSKYSSLFNKGATKDSGMLGRKSILECDVTAYDLIKKVAKTPSVSEIEDSDIDDNLSDNAIAKMNKYSPPHSSARQIMNKKSDQDFKKSPSENSIYNETSIYNENSSVLVGGQRIFTDNHRSKSPDLNNRCLSSTNTLDSPNPVGSTRWKCASEESICIPDPDYDYSDESENETVIGTKSRNPKFTYSPPPVRKSSDSQHNGFQYCSRELSKSMSSLLSDDTLCRKQTFDNYFRPPSQHLKQETKWDSSSDCSSSGGTLSSEYPTWTSSSSNELKSILKKKRRRAIQEQEDAERVFQNLKDSKKKQVQFLAGEETKFFESVQDAENRSESKKYDDPVIHCDTYQTIEDVFSEIDALEEGELKKEQPKTLFEKALPVENKERVKSKINSAKNSCNVVVPDPPPCQPSILPPSRPPGLSSSLEEISGRTETNVVGSLEDKNHRRRRRASLPKRRFSDLHLHILLCPTKSSLCGDGSSSDDAPLTSYHRKPHSRSLPDSPSELDEVQSFCFDFEKNSKETILSTFYVPLDPNASHELSKRESSSALPVDFIANNMSTKGEETNEEEENEYENLDPIYEEVTNLSSSAKRLLSLESNAKSFFEGASKIDILSYLEDAKERGISEGLSEDIIEEEEEDKVLCGEEEDLREKQRVIVKNDLNHKEVLLKIDKEETLELVKIDDDVEEDSKIRISEVERNDSGVGTETSKPSRLKQLPIDWEEQLCADCDHQVEPLEDENSGLLFSPLVCRKCEFRRCERKEIIIEFVDTELKYGRDLKIIKDEFYRPMEIAGLLAKDQLFSIFLNIEELMNANSKFSEKLQDALDIAMEHGDEDYTTVNLGKIFLECSSMLHAFETYCVKQAPASVLLSSLEKEKELLRIFLRVSQMENTLLRRMNLPTFLMVPVQRVTRYPLLLSRLHKVTPVHHKDRGALKEAQQKVELHLEHINQQTKGVGGTKIWRRISNISASHRRLGKDIGSIKLRKMALEVLNWKQDETRFVMAGKLLFTPIADYPWNKKGKSIKFTCVHALLIALGKPNSNYRPDISQPENAVFFPRNTGIRDASLVLMKEKNGRYVVVRDPLYLGNCVISCDTENDDVFEIQEYTTKDAYLLKGETKKDTKEWLRMLRYHAKDLGSWRKRRNALANIMINGMLRQ